MYEKSSAPLTSPGCLNRTAFAILGLITLFWFVYLAVAPADASLGPFGPVLYRLVSLGIAAAWVFSLAITGLVWLVTQLTGRRE
jgi:hypothetical protein